MVVESVTEAKAQLSALLERVTHGEEVIISRSGKPIAVLIAYRPDRGPRRPGRFRGKIRIASDFDRLPPDMAESFGLEVP